jgi:hypothetical protein
MMTSRASMVTMVITCESEGAGEEAEGESVGRGVGRGEGKRKDEGEEKKTTQ